MTLEECVEVDVGTGCYNTPESNKVSSAIKKTIVGAFTKPTYTVEFTKGHFDCIGFVRNNESNRIAYFSVSDYRYFPNTALVRTATSFKDYTGGPNNNCTLINLVQNIERILG